ncbi:protein AKNAD1 [Pelobates fuscus]|uniref:protein AKNAD1 n=1 Tax=Pelobates fuscus TaxID=191477 RepID=UPI002FE4CFFD
MELPAADHDLSDLLKLENSEAHSARNATDDEQEDLPYDGILERYLIPTADQHDFSISDLNQCSIFTADSFCIEISSAGNDINNSAKLKISRVNSTSDTTDDEQEDLPYDGILECYLVTNTDHDEDNNSGGDLSCHQAFTDLIETEVKSSVKDCEIHTFQAPLHTPESDVYSVSERSTSYRNSEETKQIVTDERQTKFRTTKIPEVLQRHFSDDALLHPSQFIDYETIPEISIAESSEELLSIQTWKKCSQHDSETEQEDDFETFMVETNINVNQCSNVTTESGSENDALSDENGRETISKLEEQSRKQDDPFIDGTYKENQCHRDNVERRSSSHDIKYGQGQVHYKLPDFSKIPPKVKIPKGNGHVKAFPAMKRTRSSPNLTGPSNVIKDILESMQPFVEHDHLNESGQTSGQVHAQVYQIPGDANENTANNVSLSNGEGFTTRSSQAQIFQTEIPCQGATFQGANLFCPKVTDVSLNAVHTQGTTEGERMSEMLEEQAQQIKVKIFQNLKSCLETLERNYLSTKEKHRNLQLQVYRTDSQIVGEFDTERQVAGQIFKLGMLLEDLQDQINEKERSQSPCMLSPVNTRDTFSTPRTEKTEDVFALQAAHSTDSQLVDASGKVETLSLQPYSK